MLLVALGLACIPAVVSAGICKRTMPGDVTVSDYHYRDTTAIDHRETAALTEGGPATIEAEFTAGDVTPTGQVVR